MIVLLIFNELKNKGAKFFKGDRNEIKAIRDLPIQVDNEYYLKANNTQQNAKEFDEVINKHSKDEMTNPLEFAERVYKNQSTITPKISFDKQVKVVNEFYANKKGDKLKETIYSSPKAAFLFEIFSNLLSIPFDNPNNQDMLLALINPDEKYTKREFLKDGYGKPLGDKDEETSEQYFNIRKAVFEEIKKNPLASLALKNNSVVLKTDSKNIPILRNVIISPEQRERIFKKVRDDEFDKNFLEKAEKQRNEFMKKSVSQRNDEIQKNIQNILNETEGNFLD